MLWIFANFLFAYSLYKRVFPLIFAMWDFVLFQMCAGDVALRGAFDMRF